MTAPAGAVHADEDVKTAGHLLIEHGFTALPVVDDDNRITGIVTEGDFVADRFPEGAPHPAPAVAELMTAPTRMVSVDDDAARLMLDEHLAASPWSTRGHTRTRVRRPKGFGCVSWCLRRRRPTLCGGSSPSISKGRAIGSSRTA
jgi:hypothetical protein